MTTWHTWPALRTPLPHLPTANAKTGLPRKKRARPVIHRAQAAQIEEAGEKTAHNEVYEGHLQAVRGWDQAAGPLTVKTDSKTEETRQLQDEMSQYQGSIAMETTDDEGLASWAVSVPQDAANGAHRSDNVAVSQRRTIPTQQPLPATMESRKRSVRKTWTHDAPMRYVGDIPAHPRHRETHKQDAPDLAYVAVRASEGFPETVNPQQSPQEGLALERIICAIEDHLRHELLDGR